MNSTLYSQCHAYLHTLNEPMENHSGVLRAVTLSREAGAGAISIGELLADYLREHTEGGNQRPWTVFDRDLVKKVIKDHKLPDSDEAYLTEDVNNRVTDCVEEVLGLHSATSTLVQHTNRTIVRLAMAGNCVIVGRGANFVTSHLPHVFHVRVVAPMDFRIQHLAYYYNLSEHDARKLAVTSDRARARYVRKYFGKDGRDSLHYHLTVNTGEVPFTEAARIIGDAVLHRQLPVLA